MPKQLESVQNFNEAIKSPELTVVHFAANWLEQCTQVDDLLETLSQQSDFSKVHFYKCEAEELPQVSVKYRIEAAPTVLLFASGKSLDRIDGVNAAEITSKIRTALKNRPKEEINQEGATESLQERLKQLINKSKVMLFMKGDRSAPRCGFSKQIIAILNEIGAEYDTFDILTDEEVRQGLKTYSDWPTYPQLYVKGELIGGLDIVKEMQAAGELATTLKG